MTVIERKKEIKGFRAGGEEVGEDGMVKQNKKVKGNQKPVTQVRLKPSFSKRFA